MALSKSSMKDRIVANIEALNENLNTVNKDILEPYLEAICDGIIEEIKANLEVKVETQNVQTGTETKIGQQIEVK